MKDSEIVNAFFRPEKRQRYLEILAKKKGRAKVAAEFAHGSGKLLDPACMVSIQAANHEWRS